MPVSLVHTSVRLKSSLTWINELERPSDFASYKRNLEANCCFMTVGTALYHKQCYVPSKKQAKLNLN